MLHSLSWSTEGTRNVSSVGHYPDPSHKFFVVFLWNKLLLDATVCPGEPPEQQHKDTKLCLSLQVALDTCPSMHPWPPLLPLADISKVRAVVVWSRKTSRHFTLSVRNCSLRRRLIEGGIHVRRSLQRLPQGLSYVEIQECAAYYVEIHLCQASATVTSRMCSTLLCCRLEDNYKTPSPIYWLVLTISSFPKFCMMGWSVLVWKSSSLLL